MDRVNTLLIKLQKQHDQKSSVQNMLHTVQLLHAELVNNLGKEAPTLSRKVSVLMPFVHQIIEEITAPSTTEKQQEAPQEEERIVEVLEVDEKEIEEELNQIKLHAETINAMGANVHPGYSYNPIEEVPTLSHQDNAPEVKNLKNELPFDYPESLNDRLKQVQEELSQSLTSAPIKDLRKAIGINDRFLFINELFRGDVAMYERSIKTIQNFSIFPEAEFWIRRELKIKIGWLDSDPVVKQFDGLVKRRFA